MSDINVYLTSALTSSERRINGNWKLSFLMQKIEFITGIPPQSQKISVYHLNTLINFVDCNNLKDDPKYLEKLDDLTLNEIMTSKSLKSDDVLVELCRIQVDDVREHSELKELAQLMENANSREKTFQLSDKEYSQKEDSVLRWKKENKLGRFDQKRIQLLKSQILESNKLAKALSIGQRCNITTNTTSVTTINNARKGIIRYIGKIPEIPSAIRDAINTENNEDYYITWIGVELDDATGKNDGSVKGKSYFQCEPEHGVFVKALNIEVITDDHTVVEDSDDDEL